MLKPIICLPHAIEQAGEIIKTITKYLHNEGYK